MRMRGLLIAVVLLAALGGGVWWSNKSKKAEEAKPSSDAAPKILTLPSAQLSKIELKRGSGADTVLERKADKWELTSPKPLRADQDTVNSMVTTLGSLNADRVVEDKAGDLAPYGLNNPSLALVATLKDGKTKQLLIGDEAPTGSGFYAQLAGDPRVFTIASYNKTTLDKSPDDLRDKRLLTFDSDKLTRLEVQAKGQDYEFGKNNQNDWQILKPKPMRADGGQVEELIRKLHEAKMDLSGSADDAKKAAASFGSGAPVAVAKVTDAAGTEQLQVRRDKDKTYWAKSSAVEGTYKIASDLGESLDKSVDDFRNKKVFDFGWSDPSKIEIRDGAKQADYAKSGEKWMSAGKQMDTGSVQSVVDKLRDLSATKFPEAGFTTPALEFSVTSNDGKRTEKVALAKSGNDWLARRENEPSLYQLDPTAVADLQKAIAGVTPASVAKKK